MDRRRFLALSTAAGLGVALTGCNARTRAPLSLSGPESFTGKLRIPPVLKPAVGRDGVHRYVLTARTGTTALMSGGKTETWGFNGSYLGPTIRAKRGDKVAFTIHNKLPEETTVHWHGMRLPAVMDGGPHQMVEPGKKWSPAWKVEQPAATLWYHPHPHGESAMQVYRGLAGLFLIDDARLARAGVPSTYGVDDVPVIIQDKNFTQGGALDTGGADTTFGILGDTVLINGSHRPRLAVTTTRVRLRLLNASNARMYHLGFTDRRPFQVIANDAGLLPRPVATDTVDLSPAERVEILVTMKPGEQLTLHSFDGGTDIDRGDFDLMKLVAAKKLRRSPKLASTLPATADAPMPRNPTRRSFELDGGNAINHLGMDMNRIDTVIPVGAVEEWHVVNPVFAHNFHIHGCEFRVLEMGGGKPPEWMRGPKDTVFVPPNSDVKIAVRFARYADPVHPYMYHCHILRHEDSGMMGQFVTVRPGTEESVKRTLPADVSRSATAGEDGMAGMAGM